MCYAIPARLVEIKEPMRGVVDYFGERRNILLDIPDIQVGDYLYAQGGISVRKIDPTEARDLLIFWKDLFLDLKKMDETKAKISPDSLSPNALAILQKVNLKKELTREELLTLLLLKDPEERTALYEVANHVRQQMHGNSSCVHGIIEFSNYCAQSCFYCGIRKPQAVKRYRMSAEEIIATAKQAIEEYGFKALVLQSGEDPEYDHQELCRVVKTIKQWGVLLFVSIGSRSAETYQRLYEAGARAVLLRFETTREDLFAQLRPGTYLKERVQLLQELKKMGYIIATGFMVGLPGEKPEDIIENINFTKRLKPDMISFGPFIPAHGTPLADASSLPKETLLQTVALARLADRDSNILVTTALETLDPAAKKEALLAGANSMMINVTPLAYRPHYHLYDHRAGEEKPTDESVQKAVKLLLSLGRAPIDLSHPSHPSRDTSQ